jgi:hypothetical protein
MQTMVFLELQVNEEGGCCWTETRPLFFNSKNLENGRALIYLALSRQSRGSLC